MSTVSDDVVHLYQAALEERGYQSDLAQVAAAERLQRLCSELSEFKVARSGTLRRLIKRPKVPEGVWLYGGVGRGKSFLMDCFFAAVPIQRKIRIHFHEFMRGVHRELDEVKGRENPLDIVAARVAKRYRLICFDEFHVSDIADAMILERLMRGLFRAGVCFVMTSNYQPDGLYPEGLHRDRVLPAIALLNHYLDVLSVDAGVDYRQLTLAGIQTYHCPLDDAAHEALTETFSRLAEVADEPPLLTIEHREIPALRRAGGVVWFDFDTICGGPRSQIDYLEIAGQFHTVICSGVPMMKPSMSSQARRFLWLVDVLYDQRVKLFISAAVQSTELYTVGPMVNEFERTASRLQEMQSAEYLALPRRGVLDRIA